jgi:hypothetical protein
MRPYSYENHRNIAKSIEGAFVPLLRSPAQGTTMAGQPIFGDVLISPLPWIT